MPAVLKYWVWFNRTVFLHGCRADGAEKSSYLYMENTSGVHFGLFTLHPPDKSGYAQEILTGFYLRLLIIYRNFSAVLPVFLFGILCMVFVLLCGVANKFWPLSPSPFLQRRQVNSASGLIDFAPTFFKAKSLYGEGFRERSEFEYIKAQNKQIHLFYYPTWPLGWTGILTRFN